MRTNTKVTSKKGDYNKKRQTPQGLNNKHEGKK